MLFFSFASFFLLKNLFSHPFFLCSFLPSLLLPVKNWTRKHIYLLKQRLGNALLDELEHPNHKKHQVQVKKIHPIIHVSCHITFYLTTSKLMHDSGLPFNIPMHPMLNLQLALSFSVFLNNKLLVLNIYDFDSSSTHK